LNQARSTQRRRPVKRDDEEFITRRIIELASLYGRYGYRMITALLRQEGFRINHKRVERIWRKEGLKVPKNQSKRGRIWLNDGSCKRLRPEYRNHVWRYDFVSDRTSDGRAFRVLTILDEYTRESLAVKVERKLNSKDVIDALNELFLVKGIPEHIRSDNGSEFTAREVKKWLCILEIKPLYIEPGSPWENGYIERFNGTLRNEVLDGETIDTLWEAKVLVEDWRRHYNRVRPHSSLNYRPPSPETKQPKLAPGKNRKEACFSY